MAGADVAAGHWRFVHRADIKVRFPNGSQIVPKTSRPRRDANVAFFERRNNSVRDELMRASQTGKKRNDD